MARTTWTQCNECNGLGKDSECTCPKCDGKLIMVGKILQCEENMPEELREWYGEDDPEE